MTNLCCSPNVDFILIFLFRGLPVHRVVKVHAFCVFPFPVSPDEVSPHAQQANQHWSKEREGNQTCHGQVKLRERNKNERSLTKRNNNSSNGCCHGGSKTLPIISICNQRKAIPFQSQKPSMHWASRSSSGISKSQRPTQLMALLSFWTKKELERDKTEPNRRKRVDTCYRNRQIYSSHARHGLSKWPCGDSSIHQLVPRGICVGCGLNGVVQCDKLCIGKKQTTTPSCMRIVQIFILLQLCVWKPCENRC